MTAAKLGKLPICQKCSEQQGILAQKKSLRYLYTDLWNLNFRQYGKMKTPDSTQEYKALKKSAGRIQGLEEVRDGETLKKENTGTAKGTNIAKNRLQLLEK